MIGKKGEGTFSEVLKCVDLRDGTYWACKKLKQYFKNPEEVRNVREIQALKMLSKSPNILKLHEVIYERKSGQLNLIFELMDQNLYELIRNQRSYFTNDKVQSYMHQLLKAVDVLHSNKFFHRDIKPENILVKGDWLKLADFGSARIINPDAQPYTEYISTRWYRAPECLLTNGRYSYQMDIWSTGCVMFEMICLYPLFPGSNEIDQIDKIHDIVGTPSPSLLDKLKDRNKNMLFNFKPKKGVGVKRFMLSWPSEAPDLIKSLCKYDPEQRIDARNALIHPYFDSIRREERSRDTNTDQESISNSLYEINNADTSSNNKFNRLSQISKHSNNSLLSNSAQITNENSKNLFMVKKYPYKYSQKYLTKQPLQNNKQLVPSNAINRNFSFHLTEFANNTKQAAYSNRSLTNELVLPKLNQTKQTNPSNKISYNKNNNNFTNSNANSSTVMPVISFHNKSSSLNSLISKFNTNAKNNENSLSNENKLHLKFSTVMP